MRGSEFRETIRIPNKQGWRLGQKVVVMIAPVSADDDWDSST